MFYSNNVNCAVVSFIETFIDIVTCVDILVVTDGTVAFVRAVNIGTCRDWITFMNTDDAFVQIKASTESVIPVSFQATTIETHQHIHTLFIFFYLVY